MWLLFVSNSKTFITSESCTPLVVTWHFSIPWASGNHQSASADFIYELTDYFIEIESNDMICNFLYLISYIQHNVFEVQPCCLVCINSFYTLYHSFYDWIIFHLYECITFCQSIHSLVDIWGVSTVNTCLSLFLILLRKTLMLFIIPGSWHTQAEADHLEHGNSRLETHTVFCEALLCIALIFGCNSIDNTWSLIGPREGDWCFVMQILILALPLLMQDIR